MVIVSWLAGRRVLDGPAQVIEALPVCENGAWIAQPCFLGLTHASEHTATYTETG